jgi:1-acyl-sn-glycerol-3-phosphate acyltransferase
VDAQVDRKLIDRFVPPYRKVRDYCRLVVTGTENIPKEGAVVAANHTGWTGLDHALLFLTLYEHDGRVPRTAVHESFFRVPGVRDLAPKLGFYEVGVQESTRILDAGGLVVFYPEAEQGNFKPISRYYQLERFQPGFARVALAAHKPILPVAILGGEEANPSLARIDATKPWLGLSLPLPVNLVPFPVKWRTHFMPPVPVDKYLEGDADADLAGVIARDVQALIQAELKNQLALRGNPFI